MSFTTILAEAFQSLAKNKVRTCLSMLGIVIGIASVIAMVAVGSGAQRKVEAEIQSLGDDWVMVMYWGVQRGGNRKQGGMPRNQTTLEAEAMMREVSAVRAATPTNRVSMQAISSYGNYQTSCMGGFPNFFDIRRWNVVAGRLFNQEDQDMRAKVCVIGQTTARELFGAVNPVGETVRVNRVAFEVVGLLESKGTSSDGRDNDDVLIFPFHSFQRLIAGSESSGTLFAAATPGYTTEEMKQQIRTFLRQRHRLADSEDDSFRIWDRALTAKANAEATQTFNFLLTMIASISLLVGGVGIMNIMLVSVTERTREIGLRMAVGANGFHVLSQFLTEAVLMCAVGGIIGFGAGVGVAQWVHVEQGWDIEISYWMAGVAIAFSSAVGVFFGFYPAWRASRLDPIDALRYE
ncbi:MAG: ABC transporter permease [Phycisphaerae bacterium]